MHAHVETDAISVPAGAPVDVTHMRLSRMRFNAIIGFHDRNFEALIYDVAKVMIAHEKQVNAYVTYSMYVSMWHDDDIFVYRQLKLL